MWPFYFIICQFKAGKITRKRLVIEWQKIQRRLEVEDE